MYIIMFVLDNHDQLDAVLDAWEKIGIRGVTIMESTGIQRRRIQRKHIPMRFALEPPVLGGESGNFTLFTMVRGQEMIEECVRATEQVVGNLDGPNTGILAAWPLAVLRGLPPMEEGAGE